MSRAALKSRRHNFLRLDTLHCYRVVPLPLEVLRVVDLIVIPNMHTLSINFLATACHLSVRPCENLSLPMRE